MWDEQINNPALDDMMRRSGYSEQAEFQLHTEIMMSVASEEPRETQLEIWESYISAFINGEIRFSDFFEMWDIDPADFSWGLWRESMGYSRL